MQTFVRRQQQGGGGGRGSGSGSAGGSSGASGSSGGWATGGADPEERELMALLKLTNREVLRQELGDARHRARLHRERARWLESELSLAEKKAGMWRGATPASEADRVRMMERELNFLELANRLRERLGDQRTAAQQLRRREKALEARLAALVSD